MVRDASSSASSARSSHTEALFASIVTHCHRQSTDGHRQSLFRQPDDAAQAGSHHSYQQLALKNALPPSPCPCPFRRHLPLPLLLLLLLTAAAAVFFVEERCVGYCSPRPLQGGSRGSVPGHAKGGPKTARSPLPLWPPGRGGGGGRRGCKD